MVQMIIIGVLATAAMWMLLTGVYLLGRAKGAQEVLDQLEHRK